MAETTLTVPDNGAGVGIISPVVMGRLGDDAAEEQTERDREIAYKCAEVGSVTQKKHVMGFYCNVSFKTVGGQQWTDAATGCHTRSQTNWLGSFITFASLLV